MGKFVNRVIEKYDDDLNLTFFLHGHEPKPNILIDDINECYYEKFGENSFGESMYFKVNFKEKLDGKKR